MHTKPPSAGFTLIELLVVMFIVGIIAAMATLSVGVATRETGVDKESERIADLVALASEEAVVQGREFGLTFYGREYEFSTFDPMTASWEPITASTPPFGPRQLPPEAVLELEIDGRNVKLADQRPVRAEPEAKPKPDPKKKLTVKSNKASDKQKEQPQVFVLSSGDVTPFSVHLRPAIGAAGLTLTVAEDGSSKTLRDE
jgi:type II secretion system protein H